MMIYLFFYPDKKMTDTPRLVMMIPLRRCGSNALRLRLNLHPDFCSPYPLHVIDLFPCIDGYGDLSDDMNYFRLITDIVGLQDASLIKWPVRENPLELFDSLRDQPRSVHRIIGELYLRAGREKKIVMDKSQDSVCAYEDIIRLFPDILFLDVVRDPRAQISSMNNAIIYDFDTVLNTNRWVEARRWADKIHETHPDKILTIRYEDFVQDQVQTLRRICGFLGLEYLDSISDIGRSVDARVMSGISPLWETNASSPDSIHIDKYKRLLSEREIGHIEATTLQWMIRYGYIPIIKKPRPLPYSLTTALARSKKKKMEAWEKLKKTHPRDVVLRSFRARFVASLRHHHDKLLKKTIL